MSPFLLAACFVALIAYLIINARDRPPKFPPGPPSLPIWGAYWLVLLRNYRHVYKAMFDLSLEYNSPVIGMKYGSDNVIVANDYDSVREALLKPEFQGRPGGFGFRFRSFGRIFGIFFSDGPFWKTQRRFSLRHMRDFGFGRRSEKLEDISSGYVRDFVDILNGNIKAHVAYEESVVDEGQSCLIRVPDAFLPVSPSSYLAVLTGDAVPQSTQKDARNFARDVITFQQTNFFGGSTFGIRPWVRFFAPVKSGYQPSLECSTRMNDFMQKLYEKNLKDFTPGDDRNFVDRYITEMKKREGTLSSFSDKQLILTMVDYMFASASTLPVTMTLAIIRLIRHPEVLEKVREQIDQVVGRSRFPNLDDRQNLPYFEAFLREAMRLDTLVPFSLVHRAMQDTVFKGYFIPKDTEVLTNLWAAHRDPKVFEDPLEFRPERFLDGNGKLNPKDPTMAFGLGPRLCAGETFARQVMFQMLTALIQNFDFSVPDGETLPSLENLQPGIIITPPNFWLKVTPRP